ncbi:hypothetical protein SSBR45R_70090 [Bradyrhizobium sp. SSBR45R]|nr:hypothetical protein SSBR45R_70090 [Bradyrhizobium sp. SSBR45R]
MVCADAPAVNARRETSAAATELNRCEDIMILLKAREVGRSGWGAACYTARNGARRHKEAMASCRRKTLNFANGQAAGQSGAPR